MVNLEQGQTWFLGEKAFLINFLHEKYATHADFRATGLDTIHGGEVWWEAPADDYAAIHL